MNRSSVRQCQFSMRGEKGQGSRFLVLRFALAGAASRVLKNDLNAAQISQILGYVFDSLRSLNWIEVRITGVSSNSALDARH